MDFILEFEKIIRRLISKLSDNQKKAFITTFIVGIIAHGYIIFNRISYHDNSACLFSLGGTYESGRWMLGIIYDLQMMTTKMFSVPVFNALLSILFVAFAAMVMIDVFKIESTALSIYMASIMVAYPVVTAIFSYMFTSWVYLLGMLFSVASAAVLVKRQSVSNYIIGCVLLGCSLGFYQAFFAVTIVIYLLSLTMDVINNELTGVKEYIKKGLLYLSNLVCGLVFWAVVRKLSFIIKGISAVEYKGMDDAYELSKLPLRIALAYNEFFHFRQEKINSLFYLRFFTAVVIIIAIIELIVLLIKSKNDISTKLVSIIGIILLPLGMNVVYILSTSDEYLIDTLMMYGNVFVFLIPVVLINCQKTIDIHKDIVKKCIFCYTGVQSICLIALLIGYIYLDNAAYFKADLTEQAAVAWGTELVANIKGAEGFKDDIEIVFIGWDNLDDGTFAKVDNMDQLEAIKIAKYPDYKTILQAASNMYFFREHIGFGNDLVVIDDGTMARDSFVVNMPSYPNEGSIRLYNNKMIVKLGEAN